jgi:hypothetical protein
MERRAAQSVRVRLAAEAKNRLPCLGLPCTFSSAKIESLLVRLATQPFTLPALTCRRFSTGLNLLDVGQPAQNSLLWLDNCAGLQGY